ncbi:heat shock protein DnaJ domain protein [[Leptolyngbya] sp. PCC 7376]|uniref:DnaJ domain-containing protein n=1 Tax=[Leptolyngbya] sp. PCC 7376 TaxID=111781 RepID=UPI00029F4CCE|nr:DnaJ domain-containing protein [[Leptolyngbya] sp. PCC 7376]AFY36628.1 heat shock protein DnaJ domain protein [[Leptolyngbya] sp. PCC 7376]
MTDLEHYRQLLNVTKDSSKVDIKKAYRKLAKQWHPDKFYQDPEKHKVAEEKFKSITLAYEFLINNGAEDNTSTPVSNAGKTTNVKTEKTDPATYYRLGVFLAKRGDLEESLEFLGKAIKLNPDYLEALEYRHQVLSDLGFEHRAVVDRLKIRDLKRSTTKNRASEESSSNSDPRQTSTQNLFKLLKRFACTKTAIQDMAVDRRRRLITIEKNNTVQIFQLGSYQLIEKLSLHTKRVLSLDLHLSHNWILTASDDNTVQIFDLDQNQHITSLKKTFLNRNFSKIKDAYFLSEIHCALLLTEENTVKKWDFKKNKILYEKPNPMKLKSTSISPDRTKLALVDARNTIRIYETATGKLLHSVRTKSRVTAISFSTTGNLLAIATIKNQIEIWDIAQKHQIFQLQDNVGAIVFLAFAQNQESLISFDNNGVIKIWSLKTKQKPMTQATHFTDITSCQLIDKGRTLILGTTKGEIMICRLPSFN